MIGKTISFKWGLDTTCEGVILDSILIPHKKQCILPCAHGGTMNTTEQLTSITNYLVMTKMHGIQQINPSEIITILKE